MSKTDWVVIDAVKQEMRCNRCGETEPLSSINGRRIDYVVGVCNGFSNAHKMCKKEANPMTKPRLNQDGEAKWTQR